MNIMSTAVEYMCIHLHALSGVHTHGTCMSLEHHRAIRATFSCGALNSCHFANFSESCGVFISDFRISWQLKTLHEWSCQYAGCAQVIHVHV